MPFDRLQTQDSQYETQVSGQVLISGVDGPWNTPLMERWIHHTALENADLAEHGPYANLVLMSGSAICPPEAMSLLVQHVRLLVQHSKLTALALVNLQGRQGHSLIEQAYQQALSSYCPVRLFLTQAEAEGWIDRQLANPVPSRPVRPSNTLNHAWDSTDQMRLHLRAAAEYEDLARIHKFAAELVQKGDASSVRVIGTRAVRKVTETRALVIDGLRAARFS